ncbi:MAG: cell division protein FtsA [Phocaeicola sp.]
MVATEFIVAIELGSSKLTGVAGKKLSDGTIEVLALASRDSSSFIRKGVIYNLDKTAQNLSLVIKELEKELKASISKVYVGIGGQSLQTLFNSEVTIFEEETKVSQDLINVLMDRNMATPIAGKEILEIIPQEYKLGINHLTDPVGVPCTRLEGNFLNIVARNSLKQNIDSCFRQARIPIADYVISPLALANIVLTVNEKRSGCAMVDFGADTTTVCVYKNDILRHIAVIPLGGKNITKDLCSQKLEEEDAEKMKLLYADAYTNPMSSENGEFSGYTLDGQRTIPLQTFNEIVEGRTNEILVNVLKQIELSGYREKLLEGVVFTGGGSALKNLVLAFQQLSKIERVRIEKGCRLSIETSVEIDKEQLSNLSLAILNYGKENCCKPEVKIVKPEIKVEKVPEIIVEEPKQPRLFNDEEAKVTEVKSEPTVFAATSVAQQAAAEDLRLKTHRCELLIKNATMRKQNGQLKEALKEFEEALALEISEKSAVIEQQITEVKQLMKKDGFFGKVKKYISNWSDSMTEEY